MIITSNLYQEQHRNIQQQAMIFETQRGILQYT